VYDIVFNPPHTRLMQQAQAAGARAFGGIDMLIYQGARAFEIWSGRRPPIPVMKQAALKHLP
jgi:shikimate dehydrogenase